MSERKLEKSNNKAKVFANKIKAKGFDPKSLSGPKKEIFKKIKTEGDRYISLFVSVNKDENNNKKNLDIPDFEIKESLLNFFEKLNNIKKLSQEEKDLAFKKALYFVATFSTIFGRKASVAMFTSIFRDTNILSKVAGGEVEGGEVQRDIASELKDFKQKVKTFALDIKKYNLNPKNISSIQNRKGMKGVEYLSEFAGLFKSSAGEIPDKFIPSFSTILSGKGFDKNTKQNCEDFYNLFGEEGKIPLSLFSSFSTILSGKGFYKGFENDIQLFYNLFGEEEGKIPTELIPSFSSILNGKGFYKGFENDIVSFYNLFGEEGKIPLSLFSSFSSILHGKGFDKNTKQNCEDFYNLFGEEGKIPLSLFSSFSSILNGKGFDKNTKQNCEDFYNLFGEEGKIPLSLFSSFSSILNGKGFDKNTKQNCEDFYNLFGEGEGKIPTELISSFSRILNGKGFDSALLKKLTSTYERLEEPLSGFESDNLHNILSYLFKYVTSFDFKKEKIDEILTSLNKIKSLENDFMLDLIKANFIPEIDPKLQNNPEVKKFIEANKDKQIKTLEDYYRFCEGKGLSRLEAYIYMKLSRTNILGISSRNKGNSTGSITANGGNVESLDAIPHWQEDGTYLDTLADTQAHTGQPEIKINNFINKLKISQEEKNKYLEIINKVLSDKKLTTEEKETLTNFLESHPNFLDFN